MENILEGGIGRRSESDSLRMWDGINNRNPRAQGTTQRHLHRRQSSGGYSLHFPPFNSPGKMSTR